MSLEAIKAIGEAEEAARRAKAEAAQADKRMLAEAEESGRREIELAVKQAEAELEEMKKMSIAKATDEAMELARTIENRKAGMMARASARSEEAIRLIIERIVNG